MVSFIVISCLLINIASTVEPELQEDRKNTSVKSLFCPQRFAGKSEKTEEPERGPDRSDLFFLCSQRFHREPLVRDERWPATGDLSPTGRQQQQ
jgi:hypothetical protein